ncbi:MAG: asparagine synthase (glutamine-hydrolyzing), partial [Candidatus Gracilibacteria bacterium]|nr:asparagine synthase (glutamine-hydrolyzing) [Candidatus Gracilibacteria bacterium]
NYIELKNDLQKKYNIKFKTNTDTEIILHYYKIYGKKCLKFFRGMFSFVILDIKLNTLFCARDRFGIKPFYYYKDKKRFVFASEIKAILKNKNITKQPNDKLIYDFLVFNRTDHSKKTCFKYIYNLLPGHYLFIKNNKFFIKKWYKLPKIKSNNFNLEQNKKKLQKLIEESIKIHLRSDVPIGSCLSGGLDSSTIVSIANKLLKNKSTNKFNTFSAVYNKKWVKDESKYINIVNEYINAKSHFTIPNEKKMIKNLEKLVFYQEEPFPSTSIYASWCVMSLAKKSKTKVLLDGQGSDEIFGYNYMTAFYYFELLKTKQFKKLFLELKQFIYKQKHSTKFTLSLFIYLISPNFIQSLIIKQKTAWLSNSFTKKFKKQSHFQKVFFNAHSLNESVNKHILNKLTHLLRYEDKNSMAHSIETRIPFLDHKLVEFVINIPSNQKIKNGENKYILKKAIEKNLPIEITKRNNKIGFETPEEKWFINPKVQNEFKKIIFSDSFQNRKYFNHKIINNIINDPQKIIKNKQIIWKSICLELWFRQFID